MRWVLRTLYLLLALIAAGAAAYGLFQYAGRERERAQTPKPPLPYMQVDVSIDASDGAKLAGTLLLPRANVPVPGVVLLGVAGPNDRDLSFKGHKGFAVVADALAKCGVASLRVDDRGIGRSTGNWLDASYELLQNDASRLIDFMASHPQIDNTRLGLGGLSEGAGIALLTAAANDAVRFAVLMSPPGVRGDEALRLQFEHLLEWSPFISERDVRGYRASFEKFVGLVHNATSVDGRRALSQFLESEGRALVPSYGFVPPTAEGRVRLFSSAWYRSQLEYDPASALQNLKVPALVISGSLDQVLPPKWHIPSIRNALAARGARFVMIDGANHLLMPSWTGLPLEYSRLETTIDERALKALCGWVRAR